jgi:Protein of unknown function (DUF3738)
MLDKTGIRGTVDDSMEWRKVIDQVARGAPVELDEDTPTFADALKEQLGIKILPQKGPSELFFVRPHREAFRKVEEGRGRLAPSDPRPLDLAILQLKARTSRTGPDYSARRQCSSLKMGLSLTCRRFTSATREVTEKATAGTSPESRRRSSDKSLIRPLAEGPI